MEVGHVIYCKLGLVILPVMTVLDVLRRMMDLIQLVQRQTRLIESLC